MARVSYTHYILADQEIYTDTLRWNKPLIENENEIILLGAAWENPYEEFLRTLKKITFNDNRLLACIHRRYFSSDWDIALKCLEQIRGEVDKLFPQKILLYSRLYPFAPMKLPNYCKYIDRPDRMLSEIKRSIRNNKSLSMIPEILNKYEN